MVIRVRSYYRAGSECRMPWAIHWLTAPSMCAALAFLCLCSCLNAAPAPIEVVPTADTGGAPPSASASPSSPVVTIPLPNHLNNLISAVASWDPAAVDAADPADADADAQLAQDLAAELQYASMMWQISREGILQAADLNSRRPTDPRTATTPQLALGWLDAEADDESRIRSLLFTGRTGNLTAPIFVVMGGGSGSGKSSQKPQLVQEGLLPRDHVPVDPDAIMEETKAYQEAVRRTVCAAQELHVSASVMAHMFLTEAIAGRYNVCYDTTMSNFKMTTEILSLAKAAGYRLFMVGMHRDTVKAVQQVFKRALKTGRWIPVSVVVRTTGNYARFFMMYASMMSGTRLYSRNTGENSVQQQPQQQHIVQQEEGPGMQATALRKAGQQEGQQQKQVKWKQWTKKVTVKTIVHTEEDPVPARFPDRSPVPPSHPTPADAHSVGTSEQYARSNAVDAWPRIPSPTFSAPVTSSPAAVMDGADVSYKYIVDDWAEFFEFNRKSFAEPERSVRAQLNRKTAKLAEAFDKKCGPFRVIDSTDSAKPEAP